MKTRNLLILAGVTALLIVVAATVQLTSGNLFGTSGALKQTDVVETTIAAPADTSVAPETTVTAPTSTDAAADTVVAGVTSKADLVLRGDGIGPYRFGADAEAVIAGVTKVLGAPSIDSGWGPQQAPCDEMGTKSRDMQWGWLSLAFSDGPTEFGAAGTNQLISWGLYDSEDGPDPALAVSDGKPLYGVTVAELKRRFPTATVRENEIEGPAFSLGNDGSDSDVSDNDVSGGDVSGNVSSVDDGGTVQGLRAGLVCID